MNFANGVSAVQLAALNWGRQVITTYMNIRLSFLSLVLCAPFVLLAQTEDDPNNLIENGSFEEYEGKLKRLGSIEMAKGWRNATGQKADLFTTLVPEAPVSAPRNQFGDQSPLTGNNYAGVRWWSFQNKEPRSYVQAKFKSQLKKGQKYCVKYFVSLADLSRYSSNEMGAYVSKMLINKDDENSLTYNAQVPHLKNEIYSDMYGGQGVCGVFEAEGGEQYLVIGNFSANEKTTIEKPRKPQDEDRAQLPHAYYYIDDVSVTPVKNATECTCEQVEKAESEFIFSRRGINNPSFSPAQKVDAQVFYFKRFQSSVATSMAQWVSEMADLMKEDPTIKVKLIGHVDETEVERARMRPDVERLGIDRAEAIKEVLVEQGIEPNRITTADKKGDAPADQNKSEVAMSKNRRVEVELVK